MKKFWINNNVTDRIFMLPPTICILPPESVIDEWRRDYADMQRSFIYGKSVSFEELIKRISQLQHRLQNM